MNNQKNKYIDYKKISTVVFILTIFITVIYFIRFQKRMELQKIADDRKINTSPAIEKEFANTTGSALEPNAEYIFDPNVVDLKPETETKVLIKFDTKGKNLDGLDVILKYDPQYIYITDFIPASSFPNVPLKRNDILKGQMRITAIQPDTTIDYNNQVIFGELDIKSKKSGNTSISILFDKNKSNLSTLTEKGTSRNLLNNAMALTVNIK